MLARPRMYSSSLAAIVMLSSGCTSAKNETTPQVMNRASTAKAEAPPTAAPEAEAEAVTEAEAVAEAKPCVMPGEYGIVTQEDSTFYVLDHGNLPPPGKRKQKVGEVYDCTFQSFHETLTLALPDGKPTITLDPYSPHNFGVRDAQIDGCRLSFALVNYFEHAATIELQFPPDGNVDGITGKATNLHVDTIMDGELGEDTLSCGAEHVELRVIKDPKDGWEWSP